MASKRKPTMSREQAEELYKDLHKAMTTMLERKGVAKRGAGQEAAAKPVPKASDSARVAAGAKAYSAPAPRQSSYASPNTAGNKGQIAAIGFVIMFAAVKVAISALEASGIVVAPVAEASIQPVVHEAPLFDREQVKILTSLDGRRAELEDRSKKLDHRQEDLDRRDKEFVGQVTQLREMTDKLSAEREKSEKKSDNQLEQLANVYGSMNPAEAAQLIDQLDISIALSLVQRMPEKRLGQIMAAMNKERALAITKMLSGK